MILGPAPSFARVHKFHGPLNALAFSSDGPTTNLAKSVNGASWFVEPWPAPSGYTRASVPRCTSGLWSFGVRHLDGRSGLLLSEHGRRWTFSQVFSTADQGVALGAVAFGSGHIAYGAAQGTTASSIMFSSNLKDWSAVEFGKESTGFSYTFAAGDGSLVLLADSNTGTVSRATDLVDWTTHTTGISGAVTFLKRLNGIYAMGSLGGSLATSLDGLSWTVRNPGVPGGCFGIDYGAGKYVVAGATSLGAPALRTSSDLSSWSDPATAPALSGSFAGLGFVDERFLAALSNGDWVTSADGENFEAFSDKFPFSRAYFFNSRNA